MALQSSVVRYTGGIITLLVSILTWQFSAELLQGLTDPDSSNYYNKVHNKL